MSDMVGVAGPAGPARPVDNPRVQNGASRASQGPAPVSSQPASGVRTPTDIMRQRRDREARRKAEQEARVREQDDLERQRLEQQQQQQQQQQAQAQQYATGVAADQPQHRTRASRGSAQPVAGPVTAPGAAPGYSATAGVGAPEYPAPPSGVDTSSQQRPPPSSGQQLGAAPQHGRPQGAAVGTTGPAGAGGFVKPTQPPATSQGASQTLQQPRRAAFPHAFERWETLSSHWEGLTSYWIRKLEQNNDDLEKDPLSQQLARQITDLSAAGANLFHAVVELQRLRASSERKFQRWFFDTRSEQERAKEVQADLERQLQTERKGRADAFAAAQAAEQDKIHAEDLLHEMRRELQISKEEARRAWEELGRREQEERDRTNSLRNGEPTLVGGVQVVPMIQGLPNRQSVRPPTREGPYPGGPTATTMGSGSEYQPKPTDPSMGRQYYEENLPMSPTGSDPFIEPTHSHPAPTPAQAQASTTKSPYPAGMYTHGSDPSNAPYTGPGAQGHSSEPDDRSYVGSSDAGDDEYAQYHHSASHGYTYPSAPLSEGSDEYDDGGHYVTDPPYSTATTAAPVHAPYPWESVTTRHTHPTRLSDVLEEDEPSRTSPSRASLASRSVQ